MQILLLVANIEINRRHVMQDVRPYVCVFKECSKPEELYVSTDDWMQHMEEEHAERCWICSICSPSKDFGTADEFQAHMKETEDHKDTFTAAQLPILTQMSESLMPLEFPGCPLCKWSERRNTGIKSLKDHIAEHLHSFALSSLPWECVEECSDISKAAQRDLEDVAIDTISTEANEWQSSSPSPIDLPGGQETFQSSPYFITAASSLTLKNIENPQFESPSGSTGTTPAAILEWHSRLPCRENSGDQNLSDMTIENYMEGMSEEAVERSMGDGSADIPLNEGVKEEPPIGDIITTPIIANIERILQEGGTPQCSVWVERPNSQQFHRTIHSHPLGDTNSNDYERNDTVLYDIGHLTMMFTAYALVILVERLAKSDDPNCDRFRDLQDGWDRGVQKFLNITLPGNPTIDNLLSHFKGLPSMNDFLFGPDGTVLMTKDEFPEIAEHIAWEEYKNNENTPVWRYSNSSYILAGILIETYSGTSLAQFLEVNIFRPFNMTSTCVSVEGFDNLPQDAIARPYIISTDLSAQVVEYPRYFNTPAFAAIGIYSCTKDLATFFRRLLDTVANESSIPNQDINIVKRFLHTYVEFPNDRGMYSFCGLHTNLCTTQPGNASLNRLITTLNSNSSKYKLGVGPSGLPLEVIYSAGRVTGYECCFYFIPTMKSFVIVLSNATSLVDTSDHISRLLLQELFDLKHEPSKLERFTDKIRLSKSIEVNFIEKAQLGAQERCQYIQRFLSQDLSQTSSISLAGFARRYDNDKYHQHIVISYNIDDVLQAQICGTAGCSRPFRIIATDNTTVRLCQFPGVKQPLWSVDIFADWKSLDLFIRRDISGNVLSLTRARKTFLVVYTRSSN
jgi:CubicO group peptidase (beta-lactamase class C family)